MTREATSLTQTAAFCRDETQHTAPGASLHPGLPISPLKRGKDLPMVPFDTMLGVESLCFKPLSRDCAFSALVKNAALHIFTVELIKLAAGFKEHPFWQNGAFSTFSSQQKRKLGRLSTRERLSWVSHPKRSREDYFSHDNDWRSCLGVTIRDYLLSMWRGAWPCLRGGKEVGVPLRAVTCFMQPKLSTVGISTLALVGASMAFACEMVEFVWGGTSSRKWSSRWRRSLEAAHLNTGRGAGYHAAEKAPRSVDELCCRIVT